MKQLKLTAFAPALTLSATPFRQEGVMPASNLFEIQVDGSGRQPPVRGATGKLLYGEKERIRLRGSISLPLLFCLIYA